MNDNEKYRRNGFPFHGGCRGCKNNDLATCAGCMYMRPDWSLPDLNTLHIQNFKARQDKIELAEEAAMSKTLEQIDALLAAIDALRSNDCHCETCLAIDNAKAAAEKVRGA